MSEEPSAERTRMSYSAALFSGRGRNKMIFVATVLLYKGASCCERLGTSTTYWPGEFQQVSL